MTLKNEKPVPVVPASTETERTVQTNTTIVTDPGPDYKQNLSFDAKSLNEVLDIYYYPREPVINNLLYPGTVILAGASKIGKSFLVAEMAYCIAKGIPLWNEDYKTSQGSVLYLALEDDLQRIQKRFSRMFGAEGTDNLHFMTEAKTIGEGLVMQLAEYVQKYSDTRLIIIDTLQKVRGLSNETMSYSRDYDAITQLKNFSDRYGVCILIVHHTRKQDADDCFEKISGTTGLMGCADAAVIMTRKRGTTDAKLQITGRDQQEQIILIKQDQRTLLWNYESSETELWKDPPDPVIQKVIAFVNEVIEWNGTATELMNVLGIHDMKPHVMTRKLNVSTGMLWNEHRIEYSQKRNSNARMIHLEKYLL